MTREHSRKDLGTVVGEVYVVGAWIVGVLTFVGCWIYCIASYGFLLGVGLGWLPSGIVAVIAAFLWPLGAAALAILAVIIFGSGGH
jgi:hypothetical protein